MQLYRLNKRVLQGIFNSSLVRALSLAIAVTLFNQAAMAHIQADKQRHEELMWWTRLNALPASDLQKLVIIGIKQQQQAWFASVIETRKKDKLT